MKVVNLVALAKLRYSLDLEKLSAKLKKTEFPPSGAKWLKMRLEPENYYIAFYKSGKFLITGIKSMEEVSNIAERVVATLKENGVLIEIENIEIQNIVILDYIDLKIPLEKLIIYLVDEDASYEPEQFPGLVFREEKASFLLFNSGKIILTGVRTLDDAKKYLKKFKDKIGKYNLN